MFKLKKEADAKASAWSAMPRRFWALHYFCNPLSNGLCAPVFDKISILTASDDLHALQLRHTPMQTEAYRAVLDKSSRPKSAPVENLRSQKVEEMVVRRETRQGKTAFMKRLQAFHVGDRPRLMMEHHTFLARERSTDADFTTAELAIVATERPAAPLAPEAPTVVAAARCGSKNIGWIRQEAVDAKEEAVDQAWRLGDEKQDDEEEDRDDEEWYKEDDFDAPISANAEVKGKAAAAQKINQDVSQGGQGAAADSDCDEDEDAMPFDEVLLDVDSDDPTEMLAESEPADEDADNETTAGMLEFAKNEPELAKIRKKGWHLDPNTFPPDQHYSGLYDVDYVFTSISRSVTKCELILF
ncbi:hypothetical protein PC114_g17030 [Phytophthora cactorum]|uniref:Uncharacterized protein n=3 Tax=Phytophthora cactorum TaxID=29920 RepID=A0A8T1AWI9_9STRA|nr:hypothetical protein PC115_g20056 [Phytophthora cactorum]KAG2891343.1 hypothetical protein PC114_g17030 [Phytophthora cactorum]KAG2904496.1 hypothetical protein PC117_g21017 [Phytophthora cactorum]